MAEGMSASSTVTDPAQEARKKRKAIITSQRQDNERTATVSAEALSGGITKMDSTDATAALSLAVAAAPETGPPKKRRVDLSSTSKAKSTTAAKPAEKKKTQVRYDPDVPMTKEQLASWRREARRVRNRESASKSRQRTRDRITELEEEVEDWKSKYNRAMSRLQQLERVAAVNHPGAPAVQQDQAPAVKQESTETPTASAS